MLSPKAHLRAPENDHRTYCGLALPPWRTFRPEEINEQIRANPSWGLAESRICRKCRRQAKLPYSSAALAGLT